VKLSGTARIALLLTCTLAVTALGYGAYWLSRLAPIGTAYAAKMLCSGVFVAHRDPADIIREDIQADNHPLLKLIFARIEATQRAASATFLGFARRAAIFRPDRGCSLYFDQPAPARADAPRLIESTDEEAFRIDGDPAVDRGRVQEAIDWAFSEPEPQRLRRTRAVVILHDGALLAERYAPGFSAQTPMLGWSMTKTVAGVLTGVLTQQSDLRPESHALLSQWQGLADARAQISLDQLLRMTSGLRFTEDHADPLADVAVMLFAASDASAYAANKPLEAAPGTRWRYSSGTSNIIGLILRQKLTASREDYLGFPRRALFDPLGMRHALLETDSAGNFLTSSYLYASPHDWARFGQLLLQDGVWNGKRIVPAGWIRYMSTLTQQSTRKDFGAHLWLKVPPPFDSLRRPSPRVAADAFHAVGHEGQFVSVIPSRRLVVVRLGLSRGLHVWDHDAFLEMVLTGIPR
jgi:CubicO group peptidase (beta-lactamase class C family)